MIDITSQPLFDDMANIYCENEIFDLHNDYECEGMKYSSENDDILFIFVRRRKKNIGNVIKLIFKDASIINCNILFIPNNDSATLNSFYRGRFEKDKELYEFDSKGRSYYYIEFEFGDHFEIFAKSVIFQNNS